VVTALDEEAATVRMTTTTKTANVHDNGHTRSATPPSLLTRLRDAVRDELRWRPSTFPHNPVTENRFLRAAWRSYTNLVTQAGRWFVALTLILAFYGGVTWPDLQAFVPFTYAAGVWVVAVAAALAFRPRVSLHVRHAERVVAGTTLPVAVAVTQCGRLPGADLFVVPRRLPPQIRTVPDEGASVPLVARGETARARLELACARRGVYRVGGWRVRTDFPFGLLWATRTFASPTTLLVAPGFTPLLALHIESGRRYHPGGVALASNLGESFEYVGNREFRDGDSVRDIDWRATARLSQPILREYREEYFHRVAVVLDTFAPDAPARDDFERAVSVCAAVSDYMARQEYLVDLFAAGPELYHLTAGRSLAFVEQILDILACVEAGAREPLETLEPEIAEHLARITTVVCVFLDWDENRRAFVRRLGVEGAALKVVVVRDAGRPCALDPDAERAFPVTRIDRAAFEAGVTTL
jgi:uncharacterized protein (DUF58 family)